MNKIHNAEIICVGTELLLGEIVNTNAAFIARELASLGICVYHQEVVGDNPARLSEVYKKAISRSQLIVLSGGLGPTYDDLTKETVAEVLGLSMTCDETSLERIKAYFAATGREMTENNEKQAYVPLGGKAIRNDYGTAPGIAVESADCITILLPGPPNELEPMFSERVIPYLSEYTGEHIISHNINIMGMGESKVETVLKDIMMSSENPTVAPYAKLGEVRLRITARSDDVEKADRMCFDMIECIEKTEVGRYIYGIDVNTIEEAVIAKLKKLHKTIATAESCTGGLIAKKLTDVPGSSEVFKSGIVSYCNEIKESVLGVDAHTIEKYTAVSANTAMEMAKGARLLLNADIGISATGYAGPDGGTESEPCGTVYIGISTDKGETFERLSYSSMRSRSFIREAAAGRALLAVLRTLS